MATTIASFHLLFVLGVAYFTKSRFWTWTAAVVALFMAFATGSSGYGVIDAVSTLIGLGIGLSLIPGNEPNDGASSQKSAEPAPISSDAHAPSVPSGASEVAPARMIDLAPASRRGPAVRWLVAAAFLALVYGWILSQG